MSDELNSWEVQLICCLMHEITDRMVKGESVIMYCADAALKMVEIGRFSREKALRIIDEAVRDSYDYVEKESAPTKSGKGRGSKYLDIILEEIFAPLHQASVAVEPREGSA